MGDKRKPGPCPVCNGPHETMMFPGGMEEALDAYVRACVDFDKLADFPGCSPDEARDASGKVHVARIGLEVAFRAVLSAPPAREPLEALAKRVGEYAHDWRDAAANEPVEARREEQDEAADLFDDIAERIRAALASPPAREGQPPSPAMLDLLEDVWTQFAIEVEDRPGVRFAHLTTLEEVEEVLTKAGRLRRVRPDKDWCEPVQDLPSPAPAPAGETKEP